MNYSCPKLAGNVYHNRVKSIRVVFSGTYMYINLKINMIFNKKNNNFDYSNVNYDLFCANLDFSLRREGYSQCDTFGYY